MTSRKKTDDGGAGKKGTKVEQKENVAVGGGRCIVLSLEPYLRTGKCL